jgi:chromosome segregation ATPase
MPVIKNKHLLWAASLCSAGGVLVGAGALLDRSRMAAELDGIKAKLNKTESDALPVPQALSKTEGALKELGESVRKLRDAQEAERIKLGGVSEGARKTEERLVSLLDQVKKSEEALGPMPGSVKTILEGLAATSGSVKRMQDALDAITDRARKREEELGSISDRVKQRDDELVSIRSALRDRGGDLKALSDVLAPLVEKPWRQDLKELHQPFADRLRRIEEQLKQIEDREKELAEHIRTEPKAKPEADEKKADEKKADEKAKKP